MRLGNRGWRYCLRWLAAVAIVALTVGVGRVAVAQTPCCYEENAEVRPGIEAAVQRFYSTDGNPNQMSATVFRFDSEANALASLDAIDARHVGGLLADDAAIQVEELGANTRAYSWIYEESGVDEAVILTVDGSYLYIVSITPWDQEIDAVALATTTIQGMIAAEAGADPGEFRSDGTSTGGLWDKLPAGVGEAPLAFMASWDEQVYPEIEEADSGAFDFSTLEGIQRGVARTYLGDMTTLASPESAPVGISFLAAVVAEFDTAEQAGAALEPLRAESQASFAEDVSITMESVDPGDIGDQAVADVGTAEEDGLTYELAILIVQADVYVYEVIVVGIGAGTDSLGMAAAVAETMIETEVSDDDVMYDETGAFLTGGLWDKLPADGDADLNGLEPEMDELVYP